MGKNRSGLFFGLLAGTALGILFAPKKGKELREDIKRERAEGGYGIESVKEGFMDMGREIVDTAKDVYESDEVQERIGQARETAMELAEEGKTKVKKAARKYKRKATQAAKTAKTRAKKVTTQARKRASKFTKNKIAK